MNLSSSQLHSVRASDFNSIDVCHLRLTFGICIAMAGQTLLSAFFFVFVHLKQRTITLLDYLWYLLIDNAHTEFKTFDCFNQNQKNNK